MYASLHNRSAYSFGSSLIHAEALPAWAAFHGVSAMALTDLNGLYGAVKFQQECEKRGIQPIFGTELSIDFKSQMPDLKWKDTGDGLTLTLLAQTLRGYTHLCQLISLHHLRQQPLDFSDLQEHSADLIGLVGSIQYGTAVSPVIRCGTGAPPVFVPATKNPGENSQARRGSTELAESLCHTPFSPSHLLTFSLILRELRGTFSDRLYVELAIHSPTDAPIARKRAQIADELGIPVVATSEARCIHREDNTMLRALASIGTLTLIDRPHPDKPEGFWHLRTPEEMRHLFARRPDALANTLKIAKQCHVKLDLAQNRFPEFESPDGRPAIEHLRDVCLAGCRKRYIDKPQYKGIGGARPRWDDVKARLERELRIIEQVQYAEYFLVFHEIVEYCNREGISTLARGSAADSLVCYALGVSQACPFRFDLPFDRFVNPERAKFSKMADIDLDLPWDQRDQVIRWVYERWGSDRVAMIGTANTFHGRAALAELGKAYGLPAHEVHKATKVLPRSSAATLPEAQKNLPEARDIPVYDEPYRTIFKIVGRLEGLPRHWSMHPCGIVISPEPLCSLVPVQRSPKGPLIAQYDMNAIEDLGFIKIDLLGQAGLSVLRDTVAEVKRTEGVTIDLENDVDYSEPQIWDMIAGGHARGVHHIESPAMTSLLVQSQCRDIDCLTTIVALIRPGAANQGKKEVFCRRHQGWEPPTYAHPSIVSVLEKTYGLMIFEEHILQIAVEFAGMNVGRADVLRRGLNKENRKLIAEMGEEFRRCASANDRTPEEIDAVWAVLNDFAGFMFNKAHSAEYALEAFQGAWLKHRWPAHYIAAILSNYRGFYAHSPTLPQILYVLEAMRLGVHFLPPCVNRSRGGFAVEKSKSQKVETSKPLVRESPSLVRESLLAPVCAGIPSRMQEDIPAQAVEPEAQARGSSKRSTIASDLPCVQSEIVLRQAQDREQRRGGNRQSEIPQSAIRNSKSEIPPPEHLQPGKKEEGITKTRKNENTKETDFVLSDFRAFVIQNEGNKPRWAIRTPISHIKGMPAEFVERWRSQREQAAFTSISDFLARCRPGEAEAQLLLDSGALDCFGHSRPELFWHLRRVSPKSTAGLFASFPIEPEARARGSSQSSSNVTNPPRAQSEIGNSLVRESPRAQSEIGNEQSEIESQSAIRNSLATEEPSEAGQSAIPSLTPPDAWARAGRELELIEFPITIDPFTFLGRDDKGRDIDWSRYTPINELHHHLGRRVYVCGIMVADRINVATTGDLMKFVTLADRTGFIETILFPDTYRRLGHLTVSYPIVAATGIVEPFENRKGFTLRVEHLSTPLRAPAVHSPANTPAAPSDVSTRRESEEA